MSDREKVYGLTVCDECDKSSDVLYKCYDGDSVVYKCYECAVGDD